MKFLIASDIHGSAYWCSRLLESYEREGASRLILLGDLLYHGPRNDLPRDYDPKSVIRMLNAHKDEILCVGGNCDAQVDQMVLQFPVLASYALMTVSDRLVFMTHGHVFNNDCLPPMKKGDILLHGHTHIMACEQLESHIYMNPGSVSIPKGGNVNSYMTLEGSTFVWKDLEGGTISTFSL